MLRTCHYCGNDKPETPEYFPMLKDYLCYMCSECYEGTWTYVMPSIQHSLLRYEQSHTLYVLWITEDGKNKGRKGLIKIGITGTFKTRMQEYRSRDKLQFQVIGTLVGYKRLEEVLCMRFGKSLAMAREWFYPSPEIFLWLGKAFPATIQLPLFQEAA